MLAENVALRENIGVSLLELKLLILVPLLNGKRLDPQSLCFKERIDSFNYIASKEAC